MRFTGPTGSFIFKTKLRGSHSHSFKYCMYYEGRDLKLVLLWGLHPYWTLEAAMLLAFPTSLVFVSSVVFFLLFFLQHYMVSFTFHSFETLYWYRLQSIVSKRCLTFRLEGGKAWERAQNWPKWVKVSDRTILMKILTLGSKPSPLPSTFPLPRLVSIVKGTSQCRTVA